ncbi:MAG: peroxiredoxin family protein [Oligoflexales bacterium]
MKLLAWTFGFLYFCSMASADPLGTGSVVNCLEGTYLDAGNSSCINGLESEPDDKKFLILEFFSLYCGACNANVAQINKINQQVQENTSIRYVSLGTEDQTKKFVGRHSLPYSVVMDTNELIQNTYGVIEVPQLYVIDRNNQIIYSHIGLINNSHIQEIVSLAK